MYDLGTLISKQGWLGLLDLTNTLSYYFNRLCCRHYCQSGK